MLYCRSANLIVLLRAFRKNTRAVPVADIRIALERWADFRERTMSTKPELGPIGGATRVRAARRSRESTGYRAEQQGLAPYEALARLIAKQRAQLGLTQQQLADRMGTSHSAVSRMESGQHPTKPETLRRLAAALEMRLVIGFESGPKERPTRELITL